MLSFTFFPAKASTGRTSPRSYFVLTKSHFLCSSSESLGWLPGLLVIYLSLCRLDQPFLKFSHTDLGGYFWPLGLLGLCLENKMLLRYSEHTAESGSHPYWALAVSSGSQPGSCHFLTIQTLTATLQKVRLPANSSGFSPETRREP